MTEYCRLCGELKDPCEIVTSITEIEQSIEQKLRACCKWTTENIEQRLPHSVCGICLDKLDKCWLFSQSVDLAQRKLLEIFENETEDDIETKPLATEMVQMEYDCPDNSIDLPLPRAETTPLPCPKNKENANPLQPNETVENEFGETLHKCSECDRCFRKRCNLIEHMQTHSDDYLFCCWLCQKNFKTNRSLRAHCKNQALNECKVCSRQFCMATELSAHVCDPSSVNHSSSMVQCNAVKVEFNDLPSKQNNQAQHFGIDSALLVKKQSNQRSPCYRSKKPFECDDCGRYFRTNSNLLIHRSIHSGHNSRPFECWLCHKKIRLKQDLRKHLKTHTISSKIRAEIIEIKRVAKLMERYKGSDGEPIDINQFKHKCHECGRLFPYKSALLQHLPIHSNERPFECFLCHKKFKMKKNLNLHMKIHLSQRKPSAPITELNWICELCAKAFKRKQGLNEHIHNAHSEERPHKCDTCGARFKTVIRLQTHCRLLHKNRRFNCTQCDKSFHYKRHLEYHLERHAGKVPAKPKPFVCNVCGKGFVSNSVLAEHLRIHTGEKLHCDQCGSNLRSRSSYYCHMRDLHGITISFSHRKQPAHDSSINQTMSFSEQRSFKCDTCGLGYKTKELLRKHQRSHTEFQHKCTQCEKTFRQKSTLRLHMETHTGLIKKPHVCNICGKAFRKNCDLVEHRRIHTGEKPYNCENCSTNFRTMSSFYGHLRKIHGISKSVQNREERARATAMSTGADADAAHQPKITD